MSVSPPGGERPSSGKKGSGGRYDTRKYKEDFKGSVDRLHHGHVYNCGCGNVAGPEIYLVGAGGISPIFGTW